MGWYKASIVSAHLFGIFISFHYNRPFSEAWMIDFLSPWVARWIEMIFGIIFSSTKGVCSVTFKIPNEPSARDSSSLCFLPFCWRIMWQMVGEQIRQNVLQKFQAFLNLLVKVLPPPTQITAKIYEHLQCFFRQMVEETAPRAFDVVSVHRSVCSAMRLSIFTRPSGCCVNLRENGDTLLYQCGW